ncbi:hypothetical protein RJ640_029756 [Escallonia rubra]|uniref:J domain-containing protein n=1 Tax=Escallonia rubra TaxID=112253 RepID=A0AA88QP68_9ASTE|nr:hypothetical protein RJ640_029756 [Escallonia rubra]
MGEPSAWDVILSRGVVAGRWAVNEVSSPRCHYEVLGLGRDYTADEIRSAYCRLALQRHPDKLSQFGFSPTEDIVLMAPMPMVPWMSIPPSSKRQVVLSDADPNKPVFGNPTYNGVIAGKVSGHKSSSSNVSLKGSTFEQRAKENEIKRAYKERITELKEEIRTNKVEKRKKREKKKKENILKFGTKLEKITNPKTGTVTPPQSRFSLAQTSISGGTNYRREVSGTDTTTSHKKKKKKREEDCQIVYRPLCRCPLRGIGHRNQARPVWVYEPERVPLSFLKHMSDETSRSVSLMGPSGNTWEVNLMKNNENLFFNKGWSTFLKDHFAELWDFFVFKYDGNSHFTVKVFDKTGCEKETAFLAKCSQSALKISQGKGKKRLYLTIAQSTNSASVPFCWTSGSMSGPVKRSQAQQNRGVNLSAVKINQLLRKKARALFIAIAKCEDGLTPKPMDWNLDLKVQNILVADAFEDGTMMPSSRMGLCMSLEKPCEAKITNMCTKVIVKKNIAWLEITVPDCHFIMMLPNSTGILPSSMFSTALTKLSQVMVPMDGGIFLEMLFTSIRNCCNLESFPMDSGMLPEIMLSFIARTYKLLRLVQFANEAMKLKSSGLPDPNRLLLSPRRSKSRRFPRFVGIGPVKSFPAMPKRRSPEASAIEGGNEPENSFPPR